MTQRKVLLADATEQQLRTFARDTLGLDIHHSSKREKILAQISTVYDKQDFSVTDEAPEAEQVGTAPRPVTVEQMGPPKGKVRIYIEVTDDAGGNDPVPVSVNGKAMLIPRGKNVDVPVAYYEALKLTVQHRYEPSADGNGMSTTPRLVAAYPFRKVA